MSNWQQRALDAARALILAAGTAHNVATADIQSRATVISKDYPTVRLEEIASEIRSHIQK